MTTHTAEYMRAYYAKNAEKIRARQRKDGMSPEKWKKRVEWARDYQQSPERKAYMREYYLKHKEKFLEKAKKAARPRKVWSSEKLRKARDYDRRKSKEIGGGAAKVRARHGFTRALIEHCLKVQGNACAICRCVFDTAQKITKPHADHCHATQTPRGLLCHRCNVIEGNLLKIGLTPREFAERLHDYLANPPALT